MHPCAALASWLLLTSASSMPASSLLKDGYHASSLPSIGDGSATECAFRKFMYDQALLKSPNRSPLLSAFDALELNTMCGIARPAEPVKKPEGDFPQRFPLSNENTVYYVDYLKGSDASSCSGSIGSPFKTLARAVEEARKRQEASTGKLAEKVKNVTIALRAGQHYLSDTIALGPKDSGLTIQNYNGEAAWVSGGVPITTKWKRWRNSSAPSSCEQGCVDAGHCCTGMSSSYNHPSCAMGCAFGKVTSSVLACKSACHTADNKCTWTLKNLSGNNCVNCPHGCDASDGVQECLQGCEFAHGEYDGNIWVTDVPEDVYIDGTVLKTGKKLGFTQVDLKRKDGTLIATGRHTKAFTSTNIFTNKT